MVSSGGSALSLTVFKVEYLKLPISRQSVTQSGYDSVASQLTGSLPEAGIVTLEVHIMNDATNLETSGLEASTLKVVSPSLESRRDFLKFAGATLAVIATGSLGLADDDDDEGKQGSMNSAVGKGQIDLGPISSFKLGSMTDKTASAGVMISRTANGLIALAPVCTHQGCVPKYAGVAQQFICPCHNARFANDGAVTNGPARTPLSRYALTLKNGRVIVDTNKLIQRSSVKTSDFLKV
jgi:cytochrome b6-f complex iron-sulfur subunit